MTIESYIIYTADKHIIEFNNSFIGRLNVSSNKLNIYLMDKANSAHIYPDMMEMVGQPIHVELKHITDIFPELLKLPEHPEDTSFLDDVVACTQHYAGQHLSS